MGKNTHQDDRAEWLKPTHVDLFKSLPLKARLFLIAWAMTLLIVAVFVDWQ